MLYIQFQIKNPSKYTDFQKLFDHMVATRQVGFEFDNEEPEDEEPEYDWEAMSDDESQAIINGWFEEASKPILTPEMKRYQQVIPDYASDFLDSYLGFDKKRAGAFAFHALSIFNYLEVTFEVDMDCLKKLSNHIGIVEFSTGNYPFGGLERFLMTLKAFDLIPTECFNGFTVYEFNWTSAFEHEAIALPQKTKAYLSTFKN